jgi:hypothetical protein
MLGGGLRCGIIPAGSTRSLALPSEIQGFFPFGFAQGQNDDLKQTTGTADPFGDDKQEKQLQRQLQQQQQRQLQQQIPTG